jgi:hypothetical protein
MKQELVDLGIFLSKNSPNGIIRIGNLLDLLEEFYQSDECSKDICNTCKGEGYTHFIDQGEPDLDSKCWKCGGIGYF